MTVLEARDRYLLSVGHSTDDYFQRKIVFKWLGLKLTLPCPDTLHFHDLHHVACGFGGGFFNEALVSAYELRVSGRPGLVTLLCMVSILIWFPIRGRRLYRVWRGAKNSRGLYEGTIPYEALLSLELEELRRHLGIPEGGLS